MSLRFVYPEFLFALFAIAIPIIVHLFNFRKFKKVAFTNVRFLKELKEETNSRSKLKHLLVLFSRILAVSFLVLAFTQPFLPKSKNAVISSDKAVSIFVDNSFSMETIGKEGTLLQQAQTRAKEIAMAYKPSDRFQLLTNDFTASQQRLINREEFLEQLQLLKISPSSKICSEIVLRQQEALNTSGAKEKLSYIVSDFQKSNYDLSVLKNDSAFSISLINLESSKKNNVFVDSCWLSSPVVQINQPVELNVRLRNAGDNNAENIPVKLTVNDVQKSLSSLTLEAGKSVDTKLSFTVTQSGWQTGIVSITDYPITFDDSYFLSFKVEQNVTIMSINQSAVSPYMVRLFGKDSFFVLQNILVNQMDYTAMQQADVVVLNDLQTLSSGLAAELKKFCTSGGTLIVFPDSAADVVTYNQFFNSLGIDSYGAILSGDDKVDRIELQSELYKNVFPRIPDNMDVPRVQKHFDQLSSAQSNREVLLKLQSGGSLLSRYNYAKGKVYVFTVPMNTGYSNLVEHYLFAPTLYNIALYSQRQAKLSYTLGSDQFFEIDEATVNGEEVFHFYNKSLSFDVIPEHRNINGGLSIYFSDQLKQAGNYELKLRNATIAIASLNYKRSESDLACYDNDALNTQIEKYNLSNIKLLTAIEGSFTQKLSELNEGIRLWKYCIILALLFLGIEIVLLRFLK